MTIYTRIILISILLPIAAAAQTLDNKSLSGKYYFRHVLFESTGPTLLASSAYGSINFDGQGKFTFQGQQAVAANASFTFGGSGTYQVQPNGFVSITNPQRSTLLLNARLGVNAIVGSSTEAPPTVTDFFVAIPAPTSPVANNALRGNYQVATFEIPSGAISQVRNALFTWFANGQGGFDPIRVTGHAANLGQQLITQTVTGATYSISADGSATAAFPTGTPASALLSGRKALFVSADTNMVIAASMDPGGHDLLIGVRSFSGNATNSSLQGIFFTAGLAFGSQGITSFAGSANPPGNGSLLFSRRFHSPRGPLDFSGVATYSLASDATGTMGSLRTALASGATSFLTAAVNETDLSNFEIGFAIKAPSFSGSGVFVSPIGVVNAASFAPAGNPLAPGELFSIFGSGLAPQAADATAFPLPLSLAGVQVLVNNNAAPLRAVSNTQVSAVMPSSAAGAKATVAVVNNGRQSNTVDVPLARTAPGIFTVGSSGSGAGAILHADYSLVSTAAPARLGETVLIYVTGLGTTSPPVGDGLPAPTSPLSLVTSEVTVLMGSRTATVVFKGLAPGFAALYQLNVTVPSDAPSGPNVPVAISTPDAFHDQADIAIQ
ncbi:MAG: hypothetical protein HYX72_03320 [Acidobacteria bacterium]|nr:hypothetical protein [Acidobacteriota bacterium]